MNDLFSIKMVVVRKLQENWFTWAIKHNLKWVKDSSLPNQKIIATEIAMTVIA